MNPTLDASSKVSACDVEDRGSIPGLGRCLGEGNDNTSQHSCLEDPLSCGLPSLGLQRVGLH